MCIEGKVFEVHFERQFRQLDLTRCGGHPRVWRGILREGSPRAEEEYRVSVPRGVQGRSSVRLARSSPEKSIRQLAYELGIADQTLRNWVKQAQIDRGEREGLSTEEREELRRLRKENKVLKQEREILKKAAAFFAKEDGIR